jgi:hypothetical protein
MPPSRQESDEKRKICNIPREEFLFQKEKQVFMRWLQENVVTSCGSYHISGYGAEFVCYSREPCQLITDLPLSIHLLPGTLSSVRWYVFVNCFFEMRRKRRQTDHSLIHSLRHKHERRMVLPEVGTRSSCAGASAGPGT